MYQMVDLKKRSFNLLNLQDNSKEALLKHQFNIEMHDLKNPMHKYRNLSTTWTHITNGKLYTWTPSVDQGISGKWSVEL
jgi:hypothetical protein